MAGYEVGSAYLTILPSAKGFSANLNRELDGPFNSAGVRGGDQIGDGIGKSKGFAKSGLKVGALFAAAFAVAGLSQVATAIKDFVTDAIGSASDLNETQSKTGQVFGDAKSKVLDFAKTAASSLGQTQQQALDGASTFGIFANSAGLSQDAAADFSIEMVELAGDLASFNNTSPEDAINAIGSALRGEAEPIRAYGVLLDDATLKNRALALGLISTTKDALTPQQRVLAAHAEILAQTATQQGDFARTSDGLANQQRIFTAELENTKTEIGTALLPVATDMFRTFAEVGVPALQDMATWFSENEETVRATAVAFVDGGLAIVSAILRIDAAWLRGEAVMLGFVKDMVDLWFYFVRNIVDGAAQAFGWIPGLGPKLRTASDQLADLQVAADESLTGIQASARATADTFDAGADAVDALRLKVQALDGSRATVFLNAQGNLVADSGDGTFRVAGSSVKFRAGGGPIVPGQPYIVGENGPELVVPDRNGMVYNQSQLSAMGSSNSAGGFPSHVTLVDVDGSILAHTRVIVDASAASSARSARSAASAQGLAKIATGV